MIKETFGAAKTYLNSVSLFEEGALLNNNPMNITTTTPSNGGMPSPLSGLRKKPSTSDLSMHMEGIDLDSSKLTNLPH